ncbi:tRNA (adenosine(37)-N6)-threonylcarbamoyltransferase complex dimerization subunit type 1 TsaB [Salinispirillum marinum]|uniref:tRNA threonylcarbamoyladenosine biosynthesis protein TsaB n=2 Tax=Saccharospirillaceae TaxID=255527 RepID=A0ABV8BI65_9GAMM
MTRILAIDTTTEACSVALSLDGHEVAECFEIATRTHTQRLLPMVDEVLKAADVALASLDGIACTRGPGSFTGIRVGVSAAQGLAFAAGLPVLPLSTLAVLAWQGAELQPEKERWQVVMDARMGEVYCAAFSAPDKGFRLLEGEALLPPADLTVWTDLASGRIGSGWALPELAVTSDVITEEAGLPTAAAAARLADFLLTRDGTSLWQPAEALQPLYLRDQVTHGH